MAASASIHAFLEFLFTSTLCTILSKPLSTFPITTMVTMVDSEKEWKSVTRTIPNPRKEIAQLGINRAIPSNPVCHKLGYTGLEKDSIIIHIGILMYMYLKWLYLQIKIQY